MKTHNPSSTCAAFRFRQWHNRGMNHWRSWEQWQAVLLRRLERVFTRHLKAGGSVVEVYWQAGDEHAWTTEQNCFVAPFKHDAQHVATHVANRVLGFGWQVRLA